MRDFLSVKVFYKQKNELFNRLPELIANQIGFSPW